MEVFMNTLLNCGLEIMGAILTVVAGYAAIKIKNLLNTLVDNETKKNVVNASVKYVEQVYTELHGREKLDVCIDNVIKVLSDKGISINAQELRTLIEASVQEFNNKIDEE